MSVATPHAHTNKCQWQMCVAAREMHNKKHPKQAGQGSMAASPAACSQHSACWVLPCHPQHQLRPGLLLLLGVSAVPLGVYSAPLEVSGAPPGSLRRWLHQTGLPAA